MTYQDSEELRKRVSFALNTIGAILSIGIIVRMMLGPDTMVRVKMGIARCVARTATVQADVWTDVADRAHTAYQHARNSVL